MKHIRILLAASALLAAVPASAQDLVKMTIGQRGNKLDQAIFLAVNIGLIGFAAGLLFDVTVLKRIFTPIMGAGLFLGLGVYALRILEVQLAALGAEPERVPAGGK